MCLWSLIYPPAHAYFSSLLPLSLFRYRQIAHCSWSHIHSRLVFSFGSSMIFHPLAQSVIAIPRGWGVRISYPSALRCVSSSSRGRVIPLIFHIVRFAEGEMLLRFVPMAYLGFCALDRFFRGPYLSREDSYFYQVKLYRVYFGASLTMRGSSNVSSSQSSMVQIVDDVALKFPDSLLFSHIDEWVPKEHFVRD